MSEIPEFSKVDRYHAIFGQSPFEREKVTDEQQVEEAMRLSGIRYDDMRQRWELYGKKTNILETMIKGNRELCERLFNEQIGKWLEMTQSQFAYWKENSRKNGTPDQNAEAEIRFNDMYDKYLNFQPVEFAVNVHRGPGDDHLNDKIIVAQRPQEL